MSRDWNCPNCGGYESGQIAAENHKCDPSEVGSFQRRRADELEMKIEGLERRIEDLEEKTRRL